MTATSPTVEEVFENIEVLNDNIVFQFEDEVNKYRRGFDRKTESGIILKESDMSTFDAGAKQPRWVKVVAVGPDVEAPVEIGATVLVEATMWTKQSTYEGETFARTSMPHVLAIRDEE